jgi:hypothetical protein
LPFVEARRTVKIDVFTKKHRCLALTVILLLVFTSADLAGDLLGAPVCAADTDANGSRHDGASSKPEHIDDCFCCSGCVESSPPFTFDSRLRTVQSVSPDPSRRRSIPPAELYRPPKSS